MNTRLYQTIAELERFMETVGDAKAVPREAGQFMHALILATGAKRGLEIGTSYGYSGLWIASALARNGGTLATIDREPRKSEAAAANFKSAGLGSFVEVRTGEAVELIPTVEGPIDFVLNDADKDDCRRFVELLMPKLADRAVILTDNTRTHASELADFLAWIRRHEGFVATELPVGNGMGLAVKCAADCRSTE